MIKNIALLVRVLFLLTSFFGASQGLAASREDAWEVEIVKVSSPMNNAELEKENIEGIIFFR